ncbi:MAG TPA: hypothetical protein VEV13_00865 [Candidatus Limnocylindria bacterium]|nr:hypothetical protein [Candidatus Limnocylindria bacterium]
MSAGRVNQDLLLLALLTLVVDLVLVLVRGSSAGDQVALALPISFLAVGWLILHRYPGYRRSSTLARTQIRWLAAAASVIVVTFSTTLVVTFTCDARNSIDSANLNHFAP